MTLLRDTHARRDADAPDRRDVDAFVARIGERVRQVRQQKAMSRRELSELSGVSQRYLAQLEAGSGNISVALLYSVATALARPPQWFLADEAANDDGQDLLVRFNAASPHIRDAVSQMLSDVDAASARARRVCLIGLRGAGKSTLGKLVAGQLGLDFVELNRCIEELAGMPVAEVMALYGQEGYRRLERRAVEQIVDTSHEVILAAAGGIVSDPETYARLRATFHTVWITASAREHMQRVRDQGDDRPMAGNPQAMQELRSILTSRESLYAQADAKVDTSGRTIADSTDDLARTIRALLIEL